MAVNITKNISLAPYTTLKVGGQAEYFTIAKRIEDVVDALTYAREQQLSVHPLGGGSNVLIHDGMVAGLVLKNEITDLEMIEEGEDVYVTAGAGMSWDKFVATTTEQGLWGLENLSGIPGTVGGAVVQNINAYGVTIADMVHEVTAIEVASLRTQTFSATDCQFAYRDSFFKDVDPSEQYIVVSVTMKLSKVPRLQAAYRSSSQSISTYLAEAGIVEPTATDIRKAILSIRSRIGMLEGMYMSAGSFFKNPIVSRDRFTRVEEIVDREHAETSAAFAPWHWSVAEDQEKISAAFLMECTPFNKTAFAGRSFNGTVGISPLHTLSIINQGDATAADVEAFVNKISSTVKEVFGITLEPEVCLW